MGRSTRYTEDESVSVSKRYVLTFKQNRSFDLHLGKKMISFGPKESIEVDESVVEHKDFAQSSKYFVIKEI